MTNKQQLWKDRYEYLKKMGKCTKCAKEYSLPNRTLCEKCTDKKRAQGIEYREKNKEKLSEIKKNIKIQRKEEGKCTKCGRKLKNTRYKQCDICRAKDRNRSAIKRQEKGIIQRSLWTELGKCSLCGKQVLEGYKLCKKHYDLANKSLEYGRSQIDKESSKWNNDIENSVKIYRAIASRKNEKN